MVLVQRIRGKGGSIMTKRVRYTDAPPDIDEALLRAKIVIDRLPPPDQLLGARINIITKISLNKKVVDFFKQQAGSHGVEYRTLINEVLERYIDEYSNIVKEGPRP
jgi:hypothetical protein